MAIGFCVTIEWCYALPQGVSEMNMKRWLSALTVLLVMLVGCEPAPSAEEVLVEMGAALNAGPI